MNTVPDIDWSQWVPVLEKILADLKVLNAYLRVEIEYSNYRKQVDIVGCSQDML